MDMFAVADYYRFIQFDSRIYYASQTTALSQKLNYEYSKYLGVFYVLWIHFTGQ